MKMGRFTFLGVILIFGIPSTDRATKTEESDKIKPAMGQSVCPQDPKGGGSKIPVFVTFIIMRGGTVGRIAVWGGLSKFFFNSKIVNWLCY